MQTFKRLFAGLLAVVLLCMAVPVVHAATPDAVTQPQVAEKLDLLVAQLAGKFFTTTQKAASSDGANECKMVKVVATSWLDKATNGMIPSSLYTANTFVHYFNGGTWTRGASCCGFANYAQWYVFAQDSADVVTTKEVAFVKFNKANMLKYAQPGDVIRLGDSTKSSESIHSAVVYSINDTTVTVVDSNWTNDSTQKCIVKKHTIEYSSYDYVGITRATNYEYPTGWYTIDISDTSEGLKHRDGPSTSDTQLQRVPDNTKVKITDTVGNWGKYEYNGTVGWSNMDFMAFAGTYVDTVTFDANGGSGTMEPIYFDVGTGFQVPECTFQKSGYKFVGWTLQNEDINKWRCASADGTTLEWLTEKAAAEKGYTKNIYAVGATYNRIARIDRAASFRMVAQWEEVVCEAPELTVTNRASDGKPVLTWNAVENAAAYEVYRSTDGETYTLLKTMSGTKLTNTSTTAGTTYYYKVRALTADGIASDDSNIVSRTCDLAQPVVSVSNIASSGKVKVSWSAVAGATKYTLYIYNSDGTLLKTTSTSGTVINHTSAVTGETYTYKVRALCSVANAASAYSATKDRTCDLPRPVVTVSLNSKGKPVIDWADIAGAVKYTVYIYNADGSLLKTATASGSKLTHTSAVAGTTYKYRVVAVHSVTSANSAKSTTVSVTSK